IWTLSGSFRGETIFDWPGRRRSRSGWMSASVSSIRGGQPSTTTPTPPPWDSPQVVMRKRRPKLFGMLEQWEKRPIGSNIQLSDSQASLGHGGNAKAWTTTAQLEFKL